MDKQNYRVGSTPIRHNGRFFGAGEPVALTEEEAKALPVGTVTLDPVQAEPPAPPAPPAPAEPPVQAPAAEPAPATAAPATKTEAPADAPKAETKGKSAKPGEKA